MATELIIGKLHKAIEEKQSQDAINNITDVLAERITGASKEPIFYSLPFDQISSIIKEVEFLNPDKVKEPLTLLQTIIQKTSEAYPKEAVLLLNVIKVDNLPPLLPDDIIPVISKFANCDLLAKLGDLHEKDKHQITPDYEYTIEELKEENEELQKKIKELEEQIKTKKEERPIKENEFQPITEKPIDFEENVFNACKKGKIDSVQYHYEILHADIKSRCDREIPNYGYCRGLTAVHVAAAYGHIDIIRYFYEVLKVDKEIRTEYGFTPLHIAAISGSLPVVQYLCEVAKVNPEEKENLGRTPLHRACSCDSLPAVQYLCEVAKVNTEAKDIDGKTPLHFACEEDRLPAVQYLCEVAKVNTEVKDQYGKTALHRACIWNNLPIVQYLCEVAKVNTEGACENSSGKVREYLNKYL